MTTIEVKNLRRTFNKKSEFVAVDDVSFKINPGQIVALLGPNGAGKTTTVKMVAGYLTPTSGSVLIDGTNILDSPKLLRQNISTVFGGELGFYARATAYDNLNFFATLFNIPRSQRKQRIEKALKDVDLAEVTHKKISEFSRGMRQRMHIARALLKETDVILLDEPTSGLDVEIAHEIRSLVKQLAKQGKTILLTSHTMTEVEDLADRVLLIGAGKIIHDGTVKSVVSLSGVTKVDRPATLEESYLALAPELRR
ncbi:MAG: ABC transporter ATP-binding protein [Lactobacillaceae bacterium]|jgi:ABC-2 type transport system ATP-binding protein|nr:ABC transporter ATP-binding protein [Lactobacillaceae bacterium]